MGNFEVMTLEYKDFIKVYGKNLQKNNLCSYGGGSIDTESI